MFTVLLAFVARYMLFLALHLESGSFPRPLPPGEERDCFAQLREGTPEQCRAAREKLIQHNLRLVSHIVKKYYAGLAQEQEDLISIGTLGLIKAVDSFDCARGSRFSTYAAKCVENAILTQMRFRARKRAPCARNAPAGVYSHSFQRTIFLCVGLKIAWFGMHRSAYTHLG